ncbi:SCO-spondin-like [Mytilus edulis]|uniref:SCO-spondin-like n=1 Tax=Mytilus edulis TaxID=6550 RepID=UPI0039EF31AF
MIFVAILVSLLSSSHGTNAPDNRGTEFVIAYMDNYLSTYELELFVTTSRTTIVNVEVTSPKWTNPSVNEKFTVTAGVVKQLLIDLRLRLEGTVKESKGILVSADDEVVIYGVNKQKYSNDAFLGLPVDVLSDEYFAVTYYPPYRKAQLCVVGVSDSTNVEIKLPSCSNCGSVTYNGQKYSKGQTISVILNRFDAIHLQSTGDLTGARITSDKPVSAFSGNRKTNTGSGGSQDHLVEQLTPVNTWGKRFATVPTPARTIGDYYKFIASEDSTQVTYKCNKNGRISTNSFTLSTLGDQKQISIDSQNYCYITADKPILAVMIVKSQLSSSEPADPAMIIIPPVEQYAADYTFTTPKYSGGSYENFFLFVVNKADKNGLKIDGGSFPGNTAYYDIPDTDLVGGYISVSDGSHSVRHTSPISIFGGFLYGKANLETYGFTTGMRMAKINSICVPTPTVVGDGIDNDCDGLIDEELCTTENKNKDDDGDGVSEEDCAKPPPINGAWTDWASWGSCSVSCNPSASGTYTRIRTCTNPAPKYDGTQCVGVTSQSSSCSPTIYCPIDGNWGSWGSYGSCSVTCATGDQTKTRSCNNPTPAHNGNQCSGSGTSSKTCTMVACPVNGNWASWTTWTSCSLSCGSGISSRSRACSNPAPANNGLDCSGSGSESKTCTLIACPIDGQWGSWASWGGCSVTCASGTDTRQRQCDSPAPQHNGQSCSGSGTETKTCTKVSCPVDGQWGSWASWATCSVTCASGTQNRQRQCDSPAQQHNGLDCVGSGSDTKTCTKVACPVNGNWGTWASWDSCSVTCASGTQNRQRQCDQPAPQHNGQDCGGSNTDTKSCTQIACPIDGNWGSWASWGSCSVTCASGTETRQRQCDSPAAQHNGQDCSGSGTDTQTCTKVACPIDGVWGSWASWGSCSVTCASGTENRQRLCDSPAPQHSGQDCSGSGTDTQICTKVPCPIDGLWAVWSAWGTCSVTCASGTHDRSRTCTDPAPAHNGANCVGSGTATQTCTLTPCPIDGAWTTWTSWGTCTVTCGGGTQDRTRSCTNPAPQYNGAACASNGLETQSCNTQVCIIDGTWGQWQSWGVCSVTCGSGRQSRMRVCDDPRPANGGLPCSGSSSEYGYCNTQACPTAAYGAYVQTCPTGWFSCQRGSVSCIDEAFKCDCEEDCEDGSDESTSYASCDPYILATCPSGADRQNAPDNRGTEFVIAFMDNYKVDYDLELFVTTSRTSTVNVEVTSPKWTNPSVNEQFTVTAGVVKQLFIDVNLRLEGTVKESKGILVSADDEVVIYGVNKQTKSNDAFLGLPVDVLSDEYFAVTYYPPYRKAQLCVVGVSDSTNVQIKLPSCSNCGSVTYNGQKYSKGQTISVILNRFDAIHLQSTGDLTGARITSDKPVSAFSGNMKTNTGSGSSQDHLVEQLTPVNTWGKRFATVPTPARTIGDYYKFISSEDSTQVTYKCNKNGQISTNSFTLSTLGDQKQLSINSNNYCYITADKPIFLVMIVKSQTSSSEPADPAMLIIPPIEQYAADYTFTTPKYTAGSYENFFLFVVNKADKSGLKLNGGSFPANTAYYDIPDTDLVGGYISVSEGSHTVRHTSPISIFGGFLYGKANKETYGFTTGMRMAKINSVCVPTVTVVGDGIDNDCDGLIDEELCTTANQNNDDDGDGVSDEDCAKPPPINGAWTDWASWGSCSVSCNPSASGTYTRIRTCTNPAPQYDGTQCVGDTSQASSCSPTIYCPIDGNWGSWGSYGSCSVTCGTGDQTKTRSCNNPTPAHNGNQCSGSGTSSKTCTMASCAVNGNWADWTTWTSCSLSCGSGSSSRSRACSNPAPANNGLDCSGAGSETKTCTLIDCPIDGQWSNWVSWGTCSVTCASGTQTRQRQCDNPTPQHSGQVCSGSSTDSKTCTQVTCPVDGNWGSWASWGSCSVTCASGTETRQRLCDSPAAQHNGQDCSGSGTDTQTCTKVACPIDGNWGSWASWGTCSVTCASGTETRQRQCDSPAVQHNGQDCSGSGTETQTCTKVACPIDGNWGSWASWGTCSVSCASGTETRQRQCDSPAPQHSGQSCSGSGTDTQTCTQVPCPVDGMWAVWGAWGSCSVTCASGTQDRSRTCANPAPAYSGANCVGSAATTKTCTLTPCPIDGDWSNWLSWGSCSVTCDGGTQDRTRSCTNPAAQYNGAPCAGNGQETQSCNTQSCIVDGAWGQWQSWGVCSVSCGGGRQSRMRVCDDPRPDNGGLPCSGSSSEYGYCNIQACPTSGYGAYVQTCPTGWFSCQHGSISCIDEAFKCDCDEDCEDGSDETTSYASCDPYVLATCPSGADKISTISLVTVVCMIGTIRMMLTVLWY